MPKVNPKIVLLLGVLGVSFSSILVRWAEAPALVTASWRMIWTVAILTPVVLVRHRGELAHMRPRDVVLCCVSGLFLALHLFAWFESLKLTSIASSTTLVCTDATFTAIGFALFMKGKIPRMGVVAIGIAFAGSVIIAFASGSAEGGNVAGDLLAVAGAICASIYLLIGRAQRARLSTSVYTWLVYLSCTVVLLGLDAATGTPLLGWGAKELLIGLLLGVFCTLLGHSVLSWTLRYLSPAYASSVKLAEPVFATLMAALLFHEYPGMLQLAGAAVVIGGILLFTWAEADAAKKAALAAAEPAAVPAGAPEGTGEGGKPTV